MSRAEKAFEIAREIYSEHGVDAAKAIDILDKIPISIHAWQGDDVKGFESTGHSLTGGCQVTGSYPGCARNSEELRADLELALKLIPGTSRVCLQGHEVDVMFPGVDRDAFTIDNFAGWLNWSKERGIGMDIAPAYYSHPKLDHGLSLSHPDPGIRRFWINHGKAIRRVAEAFGKAQGTPSVCNQWAPDGFKDTPADKLSPRIRLKEALDEMFADVIDEKYELDCVEPKLFGIGVESYTVGSNDFYLMYAAKANKLMCFDSGHFHPTEDVGDKISAVVAQQGRMLLHVSRGVHWDSDHVILLNDELLRIARETVRCCNGGTNIYICLDYFDASINRIAAWTIGARNMRKALLIALLEPYNELVQLEQNWDFTGRMAHSEMSKALPWTDVWQFYCEKNGMPDDYAMMEPIRAYEKKVLLNRD
ncbi:MAG: L-rhamnose isomerase [Victivallales bacterium]|nr:L-rhamnose isomerase [Victivallales bacterium]